MVKVYYEKPALTFEVVLKMIEAACEQAKQLGIAVNVAVMDDGGNLKGFVRMDGAPLMSSEIAQNKAYTASSFGFATSEWYPRIEKKPELLHGIVHTNRLTIFGGGLPIYIGEHLVGGIGVSGGTGQQDIMCAEKALEVLRRLLNENDNG
jgi:uncharacterized protein GlcG (DUF336 family)